MGDPNTLTVVRFLEAIRGRALPELASLNAPLGVAGVDSRQMHAGDIFVAMKGERVDGHGYVAAAFERGARLALVDHDVNAPGTRIDLRRGANLLPGGLTESGPCVCLVDDVLATLQQAGAAWRKRFNPTVVGITGSIGKSTTKELTAQVLSAHATTLKNEGNQNNEIGIPITLLKLKPLHKYAVIEIGMYRRGEIREFAGWAQPRIGVITLIAPVHLERLGSMEEIALAKAELLEVLPAASEGGVAILNDDDARVRALASHTKARVVRYGLNVDADFRVEDVESFGLEGIACRLREKGDPKGYLARVPLLGAHSAHTALRAAVVGRVAGMGWDAIIDALSRPSGPIRLQVIEGPHGSLVIDDTYNASPESTLAALNVLQEVGEGHPRIAVLADMLELGEFEERAHREVGCRAALVAQLIVCVGERARWIAEEARACGAPATAVLHVRTKAEAIAALRDRVTVSSTILVKGSRGMEMEEVVAALQG